MICNNCDGTLLEEVLIGEDIFICCKECGELMDNEDDWEVIL